METQNPEKFKISVPIKTDLEEENAEELGHVFVVESDSFLCPRCRRKVSCSSGKPCKECLTVLAAQYQK